MSDAVAPLPSEILADPKPDRRSAKAWAIWGVETAAITLLVFLVGLVLANSLGRYFLSKPLPWTEEVVTALLMWLGALGITIGALKNELIRCEIWTHRITGMPKRLLGIFHTVFGIAVLVALAILAWQYLSIFGNDKTPILGIRKSVAISGILATSAGLILAFVVNFFEQEK